MVITQSYVHLKDLGYDLTDVEVGEIVCEIIREKGFATFGDITQWRHSEIVPRNICNAVSAPD